MQAIRRAISSITRIAMPLLLGLSFVSNTAAAVQGSDNVNHTFTPSPILYARSATYFLPGVPELQFSTMTTALDSNGQVSFINGNVAPVSTYANGQWIPLALIDFVSPDSIPIFNLPTTVGPGGFLPESHYETGLAAWDIGLLAFSVDRADGRHYGWAEFSVDALTFTLYRYGIESVPGRAIAFGDTGLSAPVPEPAGVLMLLAGLPLVGFVLRRRRA